ncbi:MAG: MarR family transcriptional regulator [Myxococcota bacterium]
MKDTPEFRTRLGHAKVSSVGHLLVRCARLFNEAGVRRLRRDPRLAEARPSHLALFPHLDLEGTRIAELARRAEISKQAVAQHVDALEGLGVVERRPDPEDGRAKRVVFTDLGREMMLFGLGVLAEVEEEVLAGLSPERRSALRDDLVSIMSVLERAGTPTDA